LAQQIAHFCARCAGFEQAVRLNLANVGNLIADRGDLGDRGLQSLLSIVQTAQFFSEVLPSTGGEQQAEKLTQVKVIDDT
jgi:hypothetical protein